MFLNETATPELSTLSLHNALFFFFNETATTELYTLSLHDALPISGPVGSGPVGPGRAADPVDSVSPGPRDRKSTRLNSSHVEISYAVFCLKKKKKKRLSALRGKKRKKKKRW